MSAIRYLAPTLAAALLLAACSGSNAPAPTATPAPAAPATTSPPAAPTAEAKAQIESKAANDLKLYEQMRASQSWDIAAPLGNELISKYPNTAAALQVQQTIAEVREKGASQIETRRLARLWVYSTVSEAGGMQHTAAIQSRDPLGVGAKPGTQARARLVLRQHPKWGQSVYLLLDDAKFDCSKGCATLPVRLDGEASQRMKAVIPPTGEPALFIDDDKGFIAKMQKAKSVAIDVVIKDLGAKTLIFEVSGYDPKQMPGVAKK